MRWCLIGRKTPNPILVFAIGHIQTRFGTQTVWEWSNFDPFRPRLRASRRGLCFGGASRRCHKINNLLLSLLRWQEFLELGGWVLGFIRKHHLKNGKNIKSSTVGIWVDFCHHWEDCISVDNFSRWSYHSFPWFSREISVLWPFGPQFRSNQNT